MSTRSRSDTLFMLALPLGFLILELSALTQYGFFRDELYYLASTRHLDFGYVDHPPFSIALLTIVRVIFGDSLVAIRLTSALIGAATVYVAVRIAHEFGGGRYAQGLTALAVTLSGNLAMFHYYSMNALDIFFWALAALVLLRTLRSDSPRGWILLGFVLGAGLLNKISVLWLGVGIFGGLLLTRHRRHLRTRWPWIAGAITAFLFLPYVAWQVVHGWPTLEFIRNATGQKMVATPPLEFLSQQVLMMNPPFVPFWSIGLLYCLFSREHKEARIFAFLYLIVAAILITSGTSKANYLLPAYPPLIASGAVAIERFFARRSWAWARIALLVLAIPSGVILLPMAIPILSEESYIRFTERIGMSPRAEEHHEMGELPQFYADMHGWEEMTAAVARAYATLTPEEQAKCRVFGWNYGEAGAIDVLGRRHGLPKAMSGHNSYYLWGPGDWDGEIVIIIGGDQYDIASVFESCTAADRVQSRYAMPYENNLTISVARGLKIPVAELWPMIRSFN